MKQLLSVILLTQYILISAEETTKTKPNVTETSIKELEKTREELLKQIHGAIDDSVVALEKTNDSESVAGLQYLTKLKYDLSQISSKESGIEAINKTNLNAENMTNTFYLTDLAKKFRRMGKPEMVKEEPNNQTGRKDARSKKPKAKKKKEGLKPRAVYQEFDTLYKKKIIKTTKSDRQIKIEDDIERWMEERQMEKEKIRQYRERLRIRDMVNEKCPDFGAQKKKKDSGSKSNRNQERKAKTYPCCRKCCKQSYLGCL